MSLVQILAIWGAASAALFTSPVQSGEWENFKDLKEAMVRSKAVKDVPLPPWVSRLEYKRPDVWYWTSDLTGKAYAPPTPQKEASKEPSKHAEKD